MSDPRTQPTDDGREEHGVSAWTPDLPIRDARERRERIASVYDGMWGADGLRWLDHIATLVNDSRALDAALPSVEHERDALKRDNAQMLALIQGRSGWPDIVSTLNPIAGVSVEEGTGPEPQDNGDVSFGAWKDFRDD